MLCSTPQPQKMKICEAKPSSFSKSNQHKGMPPGYRRMVVPSALPIKLICDETLVPRKLSAYTTGTTIYDFFVAECLLYDLKPLAARMLLGPGLNTASETPNQPEVRHQQLSYYNCSSLQMYH